MKYITIPKSYYNRCVSTLPVNMEDLLVTERGDQVQVEPKNLAGQLFCSILIKGYSP